MAPQIVLISGCSSGIGLATAVHLAKDAEKRFQVYATMRNLAKKGQLEEEGKKYLGDTLIIKQMNVCSDESVHKAVQEVLEAERKIDVLCKSQCILLQCNFAFVSLRRVLLKVFNRKSLRRLLRNNSLSNVAAEGLCFLSAFYKYLNYS